MRNILHGSMHGVTRCKSHSVFSIVIFALSILVTSLRAAVAETHTPKWATSFVHSYSAPRRYTCSAQATAPRSYRVLLLTSQGTLFYAAGYTYHEGHVYSVQLVGVGSVPDEQTGQIYNADNICIGYILSND